MPALSDVNRKASTLLDLAVDALYQVLVHLTWCDLKRLVSVSKAAAKLLCHTDTDIAVFLPLFQSEWPTLKPVVNNGNFPWRSALESEQNLRACWRSGLNEATRQVSLTGVSLTALAIYDELGIVIAGTWDGDLRIFDGLLTNDSDVVPRALTSDWQNHGRAVHCLEVDTATNRLVSSARDGAAVWSLELHEYDHHERPSLRLLHRLVDGAGQYHPVSAVRTHAGRIVTAGWDGVVRLWSEWGECTSELRGHGYAISQMAHELDVDTESLPFACRGLLATSSYDRTLRLWDMGSETCAAILRGSARGVDSVAFIDSNTVVSGSMDGEVRVWDVRSLECVSMNNQLHATCVCHVESLRKNSGRELFSAAWDATLKVCDLRRGLKPVRSFACCSHSTEDGETKGGEGSWLGGSSERLRCVSLDAHRGFAAIALEDRIFAFDVYSNRSAPYWSAEGGTSKTEANTLSCLLQHHGKLISASESGDAIVASFTQP